MRKIPNFKLRVFKTFVLVSSFWFLFTVMAGEARAVTEGDSCTGLTGTTACKSLSGVSGTCSCNGDAWVFNNPAPGVGPDLGIPGGIENPVIGVFGKQPGQTTIGYLLATFIKLAYLVGAILLLIYFIWGAIEWLTAGGTPESVKNARNRISNAFVGLALLAGTYLLAVLIKEILNIDILKITLPSP